MSNQKKRLNGGEREDEDEDDAEGIGEWERAYVDDRSWEALQEDESGLLRPIDNSAIYHAQYRRRLRMLSAAAAGTRIQKGLIRYLYIVNGFSRAAAEMDFDLPTECTICGLTLVSSPHLARSYHHLFPIAPFDEVPALSSLNDNRRKLGKNCFGCQQSLIGTGNKPGPCVTCRKCKHYFCLDCDIYIHESLHNCPGCESIHRPKSVSLMEE